MIKASYRAIPWHPWVYFGELLDYASILFLLARMDIAKIKCTFAATTQNRRILMSIILIKQKNPFPDFNIHKYNMKIATYIFYSDTPAINNGSTYAQLLNSISCYGGKRVWRQIKKDLEEVNAVTIPSVSAIVLDLKSETKFSTLSAHLRLKIAYI